MYLQRPVVNFVIRIVSFILIPTANVYYVFSLLIYKNNYDNYEKVKNVLKDNEIK